jgi:dTDP-4-amino-4,6-dideoxygalactose transaminase
MKVPFFDLKAHHAPLRDEIAGAIEKVIDRGIFAGGPQVEEFENSFAEYCGTEYAIGVSNGTDALWLVLEALGIGPGDEVVTVPMTFVATVEAIARTGALPVFVDIDEDRFTMNPTHLESVVTSRTKAIIPVHLFGQMADMEPILRFAESRGIPVIEDAAQAHGAIYRKKRAGSHGLAGCFSFYPGKNLGALGEAGAVTTDDAKLAERIRILREHGQCAKYDHRLVGWNCRMDAIQAAVLGVKLPCLDENNRRRRALAERYATSLSGLPELILPRAGKSEEHVHHVYAVRSKRREALIEFLDSSGVGFGIHYPVPVHLQPAYSDLKLGRGSFPISESCAETFLSLPMYPEFPDIDFQFISQTIQRFESVDLIA